MRKIFIWHHCPPFPFFQVFTKDVVYIMHMCATWIIKGPKPRKILFQWQDSWISIICSQSKLDKMHACALCALFWVFGLLSAHPIRIVGLHILCYLIIWWLWHWSHNINLHVLGSLQYDGSCIGLITRLFMYWAHCLDS